MSGGLNIQHPEEENAVEQSSNAQAPQKIYVYIKGHSGQTLCGYFSPDKLLKLVKHFVECERELVE